MTPTGDSFPQAANQWDLETLYTDLASAKGKRLTPTEKLHLRGLLCGYSPAEIADRLGKNTKGVETDLCCTLYKYVKSLVGKVGEKMESWRSITNWLEEAGYKQHKQSQIPGTNCIPDKFNIINITFNNHEITIGVYLQITVPLGSEIPMPDINFNDNFNN
jgi:hypothetical protein